MFIVHSSGEERSQWVAALCLVEKLWNDIAKAAPDLWTKVTLAYPLHPNRLSTLHKWLKTSEPRIIDVKIDFCHRGLHDYGFVDAHRFRKAAAAPSTVLGLSPSSRTPRNLSTTSLRHGRLPVSLHLKRFIWRCSMEISRPNGP